MAVDRESAGPAAGVRSTDTGVATVVPVAVGVAVSTTTTIMKDGGTPEPVVSAMAGGSPAPSGYFEGGFTSVTTAVHAQGSLTVTVGAQVEVSITVSCASGSVSGTGLGTATVELAADASACQATVSIPVGSPDPLSWVLASP
jgi:hypothetical protein